MRIFQKLIAILVFVIISSFSNNAMSILIDFEDFPMDTVITNQYSSLGIIFEGVWSDIFVPSVQGAHDLTWGYEFPTHSGSNALCVSDWERITFNVPVSSVSFYYTNGNPDAFEAFAYDETGNMLESITYYWDFSGGYENRVYVNNNWGYTNVHKPLLPNMLAEFNSLGIKYIDIQPNSSGGGLVIDDVSFTALTAPEPSIILLLGFGLIGLAGFRRKASEEISYK